MFWTGHCMISMRSPSRKIINVLLFPGLLICLKFCLKGNNFLSVFFFFFGLKSIQHFNYSVRYILLCILCAVKIIFQQDKVKLAPKLLCEITNQAWDAADLSWQQRRSFNLSKKEKIGHQWFFFPLSSSRGSFPPNAQGHSLIHMSSPAAKWNSLPDTLKKLKHLLANGV